MAWWKEMGRKGRENQHWRHLGAAKDATRVRQVLGRSVHEVIGALKVETLLETREGDHVCE